MELQLKIQGDEKTLLSGGQFYLIDEKDQKHKAVFGEFTSKDLWLEWLEPKKPIEVTTQFDIPFDEDVNYKIVIRPTKRTINSRYCINLSNKLLIDKLQKSKKVSNFIIVSVVLCDFYHITDTIFEKSHGNI